MSKKNIFGFQKHTWFGKLSDQYPFNILAAYLSKVTGAEMTAADKAKADYEDAIADENADVAYERQRTLTEDYGPRWEMQQTAAGFDDVGLNRMLMAGSSPVLLLLLLLCLQVVVLVLLLVVVILFLLL